jgi:hypothetical protein
MKPFLLKDLIKEPSKIKPEYSFLTSIDEYSHYYEKNEKSSSNSLMSVKIPYINQELYLRPLKLKETLNSYWKSFRIPIKINEVSGQKRNHLFQLLPLKITIPIDSLRVNNMDFKIKTFAYLFPFGICCLNMKIRLYKKSFKELIDLIPKFKKAVFINREKEKTFAKFSSDFCERLSQCLSSSGNIIPSDMHTSICLTTSDQLHYDPKLRWDRVSISGMAALMSSSVLANVSSMNEDEKRAILGEDVKGRRDGEILFFNHQTHTSFLYPSHAWISALRREKDDIIDSARLVERKIKCMSDNYQSFLNVIFAVNDCFEYIQFHKNEIETIKCKTIVEYFIDIFAGNSLPEKNSFYFKKRFDPISKSIGLSDKLVNIDT